MSVWANSSQYGQLTHTHTLTHIHTDEYGKYILFGSKSLDDKYYFVLNLYADKLSNNTDDLSRPKMTIKSLKKRRISGSGFCYTIVVVVCCCFYYLLARSPPPLCNAATKWGHCSVGLCTRLKLTCPLVVANVRPMWPPFVGRARCRLRRRVATLHREAAREQHRIGARRAAGGSRAGSRQQAAAGSRQPAQPAAASC